MHKLEMAAAFVFGWLPHSWCGWTFYCSQYKWSIYCHLYYYSSGFNKVTLQSTHWSIQTLPISGGDSSCSWVFYSCTGPKCGVGVDLVDCNAVGGGHVATSIDQSVRISACGALALEEYKRSASVQPLLCNS